MIGWNQAVRNEIVRRRRYTIDRISCSPLHFLQVAVVQKRFRAIFCAAVPAWITPSSEAITLNRVPCPEHRLIASGYGRHTETLAVRSWRALSSSRVADKGPGRGRLTHPAGTVNVIHIS